MNVYRIEIPAAQAPAWDVALCDMTRGQWRTALLPGWWRYEDGSPDEAGSDDQVWIGEVIDEEAVDLRDQVAAAGYALLSVMPSRRNGLASKY